MPFYMNLNATKMSKISVKYLYRRLPIQTKGKSALKSLNNLPIPRLGANTYPQVTSNLTNLL